MSRISSVVAPLTAAAVATAGTLAAVSPVTQILTANASAMTAPQAADRGPHPNQAPVVAHRGSPRLAPEETLASYRRALTEGAEVLEGDVQLTKDGQLVLVHDDTLARTTDVAEVFPERADARVGEFTLAEIKQLDAGSWHREGFAGERIPTVREVLELNGGKAGITFELKAPDHSPGVATKLAAELKDFGLTDDSRIKHSRAYRIMVHSRGEAALHEFHDALPDVPLVWLSGGPMLDDARLAELSTWTIGVFADPRRTSAADVRRAMRVGLQLYSDPMDSPEQISMALDQGYDWLVTNLPETALRVRAGLAPEPEQAGVIVDHVFPNPTGDDWQQETSEHVALRNTTTRPIDVSGHYLRDGAGNVVLRIGDGYVIEPGSLLRVHVGPGTNRPDAFHNGYTVGVLNNTVGDTIQYYNEDHVIEDVYSYIAP